MGVDLGSKVPKKGTKINTISQSSTAWKKVWCRLTFTSKFTIPNWFQTFVPLYCLEGKNYNYKKKKLQLFLQNLHCRYSKNLGTKSKFFYKFPCEYLPGGRGGAGRGEVEGYLRQSLVKCIIKALKLWPCFFATMCKIKDLFLYDPDSLRFV